MLGNSHPCETSLGERYSDSVQLHRPVCDSSQRRHGGKFMRPGYVQDLFEDTVRSFPSDVAIESGDKAMTYRELEDRANMLANFLTSKGTPKGTIIAMIIQDPFEAVITILGILKAGCAFVS